MPATLPKVDLVRFERFAPVRPVHPRVLFVTNMWPDEERPYYGSFIRSQAQSLIDASVPLDVIYVRGFRGLRAYAKAILEIPRLAKRSDYGTVHVHYGHTAVAGLLLRQRPLVTSFCGEDLLGAPRASGITRKSRAEVAVFRQVARLSTLTITKSHEMERVLPPSVQGRNFVVPNGVDIEAFAPRPQAHARERLGWDQEGKVMLFLGDPDDPRKNVALAKAAAEHVARLRPDTRLHIAWAVDPEEVPVLMNAADCLLFPSLSEGSPNAVKEAMASGLPIVATPVGDIPERLAGIPGCFVREGSVAAFATALDEAVDFGRTHEARNAVMALSTGNVAATLLAIYAQAQVLAEAKDDEAALVGVSGETQT